MNVNEICLRIVQAGGEPWCVGGFVRDRVLGRAPKDVDIVVTGLSRDQLAGCFPQHSFVGKSFPVIKIEGIEVALARTEIKTGNGHDNFQCNTEGVTLEQDLGRRDLTINAMAMNPHTEEIYDPYGGRRDCASRTLRHISFSSFKEDPLRVFRAARFAAELDFHVASTLNMACIEMVHSLHHLSGERVYEEMMKALRSENPRAFFDTLLDMQCLHTWFPELAALVTRPAGPEKYHPEGSAFEHTMQVITRCRQLGGDDVAMFGALVHDLGKAVTPENNLPHHYDHESLGVPLVRALARRLRTPKEHEECGVLASREHLNVHNFGKLRSVKRVDLLRRLGRWAQHVALVAMSDAQGRGPDFWEKPYPSWQLVTETIEALAEVKGEDVLSASELAGNGDGAAIAAKMRMAKTNHLRRKFGLKK